MKLQDVSRVVHVVGVIARASEQLLDTLATSRRGRAWPILFGVGLGVGIGALVFDDRARSRAKAWLHDHRDRREPVEPAARAEARPS